MTASAPKGPTRRTPRVLVGAFVALVAVRAGTTLSPEEPSRGSAVAWREPGPAAVEESRRTGRPLLHDFTAEWCPPCRKLDAELFADPETAAWIEESFVPVRVVDRRREDGENPAAVAELQSRFGVVSFPTLVVVTAAGTPPVVRAGHDDAESTRAWLESAIARER